MKTKAIPLLAVLGLSLVVGCTTTPESPALSPPAGHGSGSARADSGEIATLRQRIRSLEQTVREVEAESARLSRLAAVDSGAADAAEQSAMRESELKSQLSDLKDELARLTN